MTLYITVLTTDMDSSILAQAATISGCLETFQAVGSVSERNEQQQIGSTEKKHLKPKKRTGFFF